MLLLMSCASLYKGGSSNHLENQNRDAANDIYNMSPKKRVVNPISYNLKKKKYECSPEACQLFVPARETLTFDFGIETAGVPVLKYSTSGNGFGMMSFTESSKFIGVNSDSSNGGNNLTDGFLKFDLNENGYYEVPAEKMRGGFRYVSITTDTDLIVEDFYIKYTPAPNLKLPADYKNYFYSSDRLLNRIWYSGAYTTQTNIIDPCQGRVWPAPKNGWDNSACVSGGRSVLVDGAKRDRAVWPGDLAVSALTSYVAFDDVESIRNALTSIYDGQRGSGELPMVGPPIWIYDSDTYHLWALLTTYNYVAFSNDFDWFSSVQDKYERALDYSIKKIGPSGLMYVTGKNDWTRSAYAGQGGENIVANSLLFGNLNNAAKIYLHLGLLNKNEQYEKLADLLNASINEKLWDTSVGAFKDNPVSNIFPQDGNSVAILLDVVKDKEKVSKILHKLNMNINHIGARSPEWGNKISTFAGSLEILARLKSYDIKALEIAKTEWMYMIDYPEGTGTLWEGMGENGEFDFGDSYMSLSHSWASGPTAALTFYLLGVRPSGFNREYIVNPFFADMNSVEGDLSFGGNNKVAARFEKCSDGYCLYVDSRSYPESNGTLLINDYGDMHYALKSAYRNGNYLLSQGDGDLAFSEFHCESMDGSIRCKNLKPDIYKFIFSVFKD